MDKSKGGPTVAGVIDKGSMEPHYPTDPWQMLTATEAGRRNRVLVVDDDPDIRDLVVVCLKDAGFDTLEADGRAPAIRRFLRERPDAVVLDLCMPDVEGYELIETLRQADGFRLTPIIILTSRSPAETAQRAFDAGASDFMTKPVQPDLLNQRVQYALRNSLIARNSARDSELLRHAQELARLGYWEFFPNAGRFKWSQGLHGMFGLPSDVVPTLDLVLDRIHPGDVSSIREEFESILNSEDRNDGRDLELRIFTQNGQERTLSLRAKPTRNARGKVCGLFGVVQDVSRRKQAEERLAYLDRYDALTGLPKQSVLQDRLHQAILVTNATGGSVALMALELDIDSKSNQALEQANQDECIRLTAALVQRAAGPTATVSRRGQQQFLILLPGAGDKEQVAQIAETILAAFHEPVHVTDTPFYLAPNLGIQIHDAGQTNQADAMLQSARLAAENAQELGGHTYRFFDPEMRNRSQRRFRIESELHGAVERDELHLQFQPQVTVADGTTKGAEVLLRWHHATEGDISPSRFVPVLEETGLIRTVDRWLLREACEQAARWHASSGLDLTVSVNLSARQLSDPSLIEIVSDAIEVSKLSPKCLELEITEHTLMEDLESSVRILRALKAVGVGVAIDDFGTGYASLTYLRQLPIDTIKIDGSFVRGIADDPVNATIVRSTIDLAHGLGLQTVAEGVERQSDLEQLKAFGCDLVQGYLTCRPLRGEQLIDWLGGGKQAAPRRKAG